MATDWLVFVLILLALSIGFFWGRYSSKRGSAQLKLPSLSRSGQAAGFPSDSYLSSFNQLLNGQSDQTVENFVSSLEVNDQTLDTHLSLGIFFRRKGEVDRAIRVHQNLLGHPRLNTAQMELAQQELACDYQQSGLLDRAESLFQQLAGSANMQVKQGAYKQLLSIYQTEQEWQKAIGAAEMLCSKRPIKNNNEHFRRLQSHFCCELAELAWQRQAQSEYASWVQKAITYDRSNPRSTALVCRMQIQEGDFKAAKKSLDLVAHHAELFPLLTDLASSYFAEQGGHQALYDYLLEVYQAKPGEHLLLSLSDCLVQLRSELEAVEFLTQELLSYEGLNMIGATLQAAQGARMSYSELRAIIQEQISPIFICSSCGFQAGSRFWCCPTCKSWV